LKGPPFSLPGKLGFPPSPTLSEIRTVLPLKVVSSRQATSFSPADSPSFFPPFFRSHGNDTRSSFAPSFYLAGRNATHSAERTRILPERRTFRKRRGTHYPRRVPPPRCRPLSSLPLTPQRRETAPENPPPRSSTKQDPFFPLQKRGNSKEPFSPLRKLPLPFNKRGKNSKTSSSLKGKEPFFPFPFPGLSNRNKPPPFVSRSTPFPFSVVFPPSGKTTLY